MPPLVVQWCLRCSCCRQSVASWPRTYNTGLWIQNGTKFSFSKVRSDIVQTLKRNHHHHHHHHHHHSHRHHHHHHHHHSHRHRHRRWRHRHTKNLINHSLEPGRPVLKSHSSCSSCCYHFSKGPKILKAFLILSGAQRNCVHIRADIVHRSTVSDFPLIF